MKPSILFFCATLSCGPLLAAGFHYGQVAPDAASGFENLPNAETREAFLRGYVTGALDAIHHEHDWCLPPQMTAVQAYAIVSGYHDLHPEEPSEPTATMASAALGTRYACRSP